MLPSIINRGNKTVTANKLNDHAMQCVFDGDTRRQWSGVKAGLASGVTAGTTNYCTLYNHTPTPSEIRASVITEGYWRIPKDSVARSYDHRTYTAIVVVGYHQINTAIAVFYSVLGGLFGRYYLNTAPHLHRAAASSHLNATSFDPASVQSTTPPALPGALASRLANDTTAGTVLGTILSEAITTVLLSAPSTVACSEQLAHSRTAPSGSHDIHLFPINNPSFDTDQYSPPPPARRWHVKTTPPLAQLQIPAIVTTLPKDTEGCQRLPKTDVRYARLFM